MYTSTYSFLLSLHSWNRWAVLITLIWAIGNSYYKKRNQLTYSLKDQVSKFAVLLILYTQEVLGILLYAKSALSQFFIQNTGEGISLREVRFFGLEHITVMLLSLIVITIGSVKIHQSNLALDKHRLTAQWFGVGLLLILSSIPWSFSPLISRPLFRF